jgi:hypothetical protein
MSAKIAHKIKKRENPNDIFITPIKLAKIHIDYIDSDINDIWLDPCRNNENGSYYSQFPNNKKWCEILEDKDFFEFDECINIICCNPPYSILDKWIEHCIKLNPRVISFLIGVGNLTARRIEMFNKNNYGITKLKMLKVYKWYGMSYIVVFEKNKNNIIDIDRTVFK